MDGPESYAKTFLLAHQVRTRLNSALSKPDYSLRELVETANFLDSIMEKIHDREYFLQKTSTQTYNNDSESESENDNDNEIENESESEDEYYYDSNYYNEYQNISNANSNKINEISNEVKYKKQNRKSKSKSTSRKIIRKKQSINNMQDTNLDININKSDINDNEISDTIDKNHEYNNYEADGETDFIYENDNDNDNDNEDYDYDYDYDDEYLGSDSDSDSEMVFDGNFPDKPLLQSNSSDTQFESCNVNFSPDAICPQVGSSVLSELSLPSYSRSYRMLPSLDEEDEMDEDEYSENYINDYIEKEEEKIVENSNTTENIVNTESQHTRKDNLIPIGEEDITSSFNSKFSNLSLLEKKPLDLENKTSIPTVATTTENIICTELSYRSDHDHDHDHDEHGGYLTPSSTSSTSSLAETSYTSETCSTPTSPSDPNDHELSDLFRFRYLDDSNPAWNKKHEYDFESSATSVLKHSHEKHAHFAL